MIVHPDLRAPSGSDAPLWRDQVALAEALADWRKSPAVLPLGPALELFGKGTDLAGLAPLAALFAPGGGALALVRALVDPLVAALAAHPLGHVQLRHFSDDTLSTLVLMSSGSAILSLCAVDGVGLARKSAPMAASFAPNETWEIVLAGSAQAELVRLVGTRLERESVVLEPNQSSHRSGLRETLLLGEVCGSLVTLKLQRRAADGAVTRDYRLEDGAMIHQSAGSPRDSRLELAVALLGRMERHDAAPLLAAMSGEGGSASVRWQALRECLALDTATGFAALGRLAATADDPLAAPAQALHAQLLERYPALAGVEPCPV